jgi:hypothetical protein
VIFCAAFGGLAGHHYYLGSSQSQLFGITFVSHITKLKTTGTLSLLAAYQLFSKPIVLLRLSLEG